MSKVRYRMIGPALMLEGRAIHEAWKNWAARKISRKVRVYPVSRKAVERQPSAPTRGAAVGGADHRILWSAKGEVRLGVGRRHKPIVCPTEQRSRNQRCAVSEDRPSTTRPQATSPPHEIVAGCEGLMGL